MKVLYFAWLRERIGSGEEEVPLSGGIATVGDLMRWLAARSEGHAAAFADPAVVRAAVNREHATPETPIRDGDEVAFFPPVTGG